MFCEAMFSKVYESEFYVIVKVGLFNNFQILFLVYRFAKTTNV